MIFASDFKGAQALARFEGSGEGAASRLCRGVGIYFRILSRAVNGDTFQIALIMSTVSPIAVYFISGIVFKPSLLTALRSLFAVLVVLSSTHVFATVYLLADKDATVGMEHRLLKMAVIPIGILVVNLLMATVVDLRLLMVFMLFYIHWSMWHFGMQNLGVFAFSSAISRQAPMEKTERLLITGGVACGVLGAWRVYAPELMLNSRFYPLETGRIGEGFRCFQLLGAILYGVVALGFIGQVFHRRKFHTGKSLVTFFLAVFFFAPIYLSNDRKYFFFSYATAHGLQYLVFLAWHAFQTSRERFASEAKSPSGQSPGARGHLFNTIHPVGTWWRMGRPQVFFALILLTAFFLWHGWRGLSLPIFTETQTFKVGTGLILGLTMAHYWLDQHLWRFSNRARREWLLRKYPFLRFQSA